MREVNIGESELVYSFCQHLDPMPPPVIFRDLSMRGRAGCPSPKGHRKVVIDSGMSQFITETVPQRMKAGLLAPRADVAEKLGEPFAEGDGPYALGAGIDVSKELRLPRAPFLSDICHQAKVKKALMDRDQPFTRTRF